VPEPNSVILMGLGGLGLLGAFGLRRRRATK
jgi:PEP-CTERM motif